MKKTKIKISTLVSMLFLATTLFVSCSDDDTITDTDDTSTITDDDDTSTIDDADFVATDWTPDTHSKDADPNFDEVFCHFRRKLAKYAR